MDDAYDPTARGLQNLGNSCYINSVVQVLGTINGLNTALGGTLELIEQHSDKQGENEEDASSTRTTHSLAETLSELQKDVNTLRKDDAFNPSTLVDISRGTFGLDQQDAQEWLRFILTAVDEEVTTAFKNLDIEPTTPLEGLSGTASSACGFSATGETVGQRRKRTESGSDDGETGSSGAGVVTSTSSKRRKTNSKMAVAGDEQGTEGSPSSSNSCRAGDGQDEQTSAVGGSAQELPTTATTTSTASSGENAGVENAGVQSLADSSAPQKPKFKSPVYATFQGSFAAVTKCLVCESKSVRTEDFLDLSLPVQQHCSVSWGLSQLTHTERLRGDNKYYCEVCHCKTEAIRTVKLASIPPVVCFHLNRFKYTPTGQVKLRHRVAAPQSLRFARWCEPDCEYAGATYELMGVTFHMGATSSSGHYVCYTRTPHVVKGSRMWNMCDDATVSLVTEQVVLDAMMPSVSSLSSSTAYLLFYERVSS